MTSIGFVGLGNMGSPMARNLLAAGHAVTAFDIDPARAAALESLGGRAAATAGDAVGSVDVVVTMLPAGPQVAAAYLGDDGLIAAAAPEALLVDCSTIDVATARRVAAAAAQRGLAMVDAPVSGGVMGAANATLSFMVGGPDEAFERARPLLEVMGRTIVHTGGSGTGQAAKICNNMILGASMIAVGEAFVLAEGLGLDPRKLFDVSSRSSGQCWSLTTYCPVPGPVPTSPANHGFKAGFTADMMAKDLRLAQQAAIDSGVSTPIGAAAAALYGLFQAAGSGDVDFSGIIEMLRGEKSAAGLPAQDC